MAHTDTARRETILSVGAYAQIFETLNEQMQRILEVNVTQRRVIFEQIRERLGLVHSDLLPDHMPRTHEQLSASLDSLFSAHMMERALDYSLRIDDRTMDLPEEKKDAFCGDEKERCMAASRTIVQSLKDAAATVDRVRQPNARVA